MLTRFSLDPEALLSASEGEHKRLLRLWLRHGVLCHNAGTFKESELFPVLSDLPQAARKLWKATLTKAWIKPAPEEWQGWLGLEDRPEEASVLNGNVDLAGLDKNRLKYVKDDIKQSCPDLEICLIKDIDNSASFERSGELSEQFVRNISIDDLWTQRFDQMANLSKFVTIVDSYALDPDNVAGLRQFLLKLDAAHETRTKVTIYAAYGRGSQSCEDASNRVCAIGKELCRGGVGDINLRLLDSRDFNKWVLRDRFIVFDRMVVELGHGVMLFAEKQAYPMTFTAKIKQSEHKKIIKNLREKSSWSQVRKEKS